MIRSSSLFLPKNGILNECLVILYCNSEKTRSLNNNKVKKDTCISYTFLTVECTKELEKYSQQFLKNQYLKTKGVAMKHSISQVPITHRMLGCIKYYLCRRILVKKDSK